MGGKSGGFLGAGIVVLAIAAAGCGYEGSSNPTGLGSGDSATTGTPAYLGSGAAADRSRFRVFAATGNIAATLAEFRVARGEPLNVGRREIRWDGVPLDQLNVNTFPGDFFNTVVKAGAIFTTDGIGFRNSNRDFSDIDPAYADQFNAFSPLVTFMPIGSAGLTVSFRVPGFETRAATEGFGVVFSDVERVGSASIKLFDAEGRSLGQYHAPVRSDAAGFSFVGVVFDSPLVAQVRITSGQRALGAGVQDLSDGGNLDLAVMDDYLYAEPQAIP